MKLSYSVRMAVCALLLQGAVSVHAQTSYTLSTPPNIARWMYPFNGEVTNRIDASTFAAFGYIGDNPLGSFDTRDGQFLLGWNTSSSGIPTGRGATHYSINYVLVTLTISGEGDQYAYDDQQHPYTSYFPPNTNNLTSPVELYGVGYRGGYTNASNVFVPYSATNFQQGTTFFADPNAGDYTNRTAYAACYNTNGVLVDVSDNVGDDGTNEIPTAFEVTPFAIGQNVNFTVGELMPTGSQLTFALNLDDTNVVSYIQQGLNQGNLNFMISSLVNASYISGGSPNWPDFYTIFDSGISTNEYPIIDIGVTISR